MQSYGSSGGYILKKGIVLGATLCAIGSCSLASAQSSQNTLSLLSNKSLALNASAAQTGLGAAPPPQPSYFTVRAGLDFAIDGRLSDYTPILIGGGIDYTFSDAFVKNGETFISVDGMFRTRGSARANLFPFCINERFFLSPKGQNASPLPGTAYAFIGLGATLFDVGSSTFRFGGRAGLGTYLGSNWIAEASLYISSPDNGVAADMVGVYLGYKFGG
jgi:opacity protein-like surface antigen